MRQVSVVIAVALLGAAVAGCAAPYQRYGYAYQSYPAYTVYHTAAVPVATTQVAYVYPTTTYATYQSYDYDRYYMGIHPGPELKRTFP